LKDGKDFASDFYSSKITGALCITESVPINSEKQSIIEVFGMDIRCEDLMRTE